MRLTLQNKSIENSIIYYALIVLACMNFFEEGALLTLILGLFFLCNRRDVYLYAFYDTLRDCYGLRLRQSLC